MSILLGWCMTGHHTNCRTAYTTGTGINRTCECHCHQEEDQCPT